MTGNWNINYDRKVVSYDFNVSTPLVGKVLLTRQHIDQTIQYLETTKKDITEITTNQLEGIKLRDVTFEELDELIVKFELFVADLKQLKDKADHPSVNQDPIKE